MTATKKTTKKRKPQEEAAEVCAYCSRPFIGNWNREECEWCGRGCHASPCALTIVDRNPTRMPQVTIGTLRFRCWDCDQSEH